ncbi:pilus assembly protein [Enterobacteriaceae bacterium ESL0689]|nr:pilus assembly protein [Enterobacteriaceae bacterium ESL0689]
MAFLNWRIGMHIQHDAIVLVALRYTRARWQLCRWWQITLMPGIVDQGVVIDAIALARQLQDWRRELPWQHQVSVAFPANRTLQKRVPCPQQILNDSEQARWITGVMSQQLEMPASALCVDYCAVAQNKEWQVTAAQQSDIDKLRQLAASLKLRMVAIVPDANALSPFLSRLPEGSQGLAWRGDRHWLWATQDEWGSISCTDVPLFSQLASRIAVNPLCLCADPPTDDRCFNPWSVIHHLYPPLPDDGNRFAIALGLALGESIK